MCLCRIILCITMTLLLILSLFYVYASNNCILDHCVCVGSYYLVDSRLPISISFLPPHKSTRYHAQEFCSSNRQPTSKKELYNYRH